MNFGNLGFMEIMLILIAVLLLFGAKRLPEIGASMGKGIKEFKKSFSDVDKSLREPERDVVRSDRDYRTDRLAAGDAPVRRDDDESRPEPKRLLQ